ncbi:MAG: thiamine pyrophosphate-binding protein, partial [Erysipelotrichaceae bacterium]
MRLTVADYIVKYLDNQFIEIDGKEIKFVEGIFTIFGHGNVLGLGQSLEFEEHNLNVLQGKSEQGMAHAAIGFSKQRNRQAIYAVTTSIGPGCTNLVTAAATATVNKIPLLLFPGDTFESRQPDPVLQQLEHPISASVTASNTLHSVSMYFDRITHPEQIQKTLDNAFSILTCPERTGAVTISLPQDIQVSVIDVDEELLKKKVWNIKRRIPSDAEITMLTSCIKKHEKIVFVCGGGVKYSEASQELQDICESINVPLVETQSGKSAIPKIRQNMGGIGVTGTLAAN